MFFFSTFFKETESPAGRQRGKTLGSKKLTALERLKKARLGEKVIFIFTVWPNEKP